MYGVPHPDQSAHTPYSDVISSRDHLIAGHCHSKPDPASSSTRRWPSILPACLQMMTRNNLCRTAWRQSTLQTAAQTSGMTHCHHQMSSYRPCSLPRRPSINTSAMPCLCPPQTLCTLSSQGLDANKEIHHPRTNSGLEGTIHCHPAFTNGYQGQRHPGLAASFLVEGRKSRMNCADLSRSLKMRLLHLSGL
ncbi:uncharacterized protein WM277_026865 isoform 1-T1 [Molossus nigricans]